jgi:DNA-binding CsgD family transcriptional regulator
MAALEDLIRTELLDAADEGIPDMTPREVQALTVRLARKLRPLLLGEAAIVDATRKVRRRDGRPTERQLQALLLLADSADTAAVAAALRVSRPTVHDHLRRLADRFGVAASHCVLVDAGFALGWLPLPDEKPVVDLDAQDISMLGLLAAGRADELEEALGCSTARVLSRKARLMRELGAGTDAGLVAAGWRAGVLPVAPAVEVAA